MRLPDAADEQRENRSRARRAEAALAGATDDHVDDQQGVFGVTVAGTAYPTVKGVYYWIRPSRITGPEVEGGAATFAPTGEPDVLAFYTGVAAPASGTPVMALPDGNGRWLF